MSRTADEPRESAELLAFLSDPQSYPGEPATRVEIRETHMSRVFLTDRFAYKLKKRVRLPFLDLTRLEARRRNCESELRLNRRLADWVYLAVVAVTRESDGRLALGGDGEPVDYLVKMRRLAEALMLDHRLAALEGPSEIAPVARHLSRFLARSPAAERNIERHLTALAREITLDVSTLAKPADSLPRPLVSRALGALFENFARMRPQLARRVAAGHIIDAHGDLRPEHVYLGAPPAIIDCLEFSRRLRLRDRIDEIAFLGLECRRLGRGEVGLWFREVYEKEAGERPDDALYAFYAGFRAVQRARLAVWHAADPEPRAAAHWYARARRYLELALEEFARCR